MTTIQPCYQNQPSLLDAEAAVQRGGTIRVCAPEVVILGELVGCLRCHAYLDGYLRAPSNGFCPDCGTHIKTLRQQQAKHAILARRYESLEVS